MSLVAKAFEEGVKAALKFFQSPATKKALAKSGEAVMNNMRKAVKAATKVKK